MPAKALRIATRPAAPSSCSAPKRGALLLFDFAPGSGARADKLRGAGIKCPACLHTPLSECAACGRSAAIALPAGKHAISLCPSCAHALVVAREECQREQFTDAEAQAKMAAAAHARQAAIIARATAAAQAAGKQSTNDSNRAATRSAGRPRRDAGAVTRKQGAA